MKILVVSPVFWPEAFRINDLAFELVRRGHEVEVLAGLPNYPEGRFFPGYGWTSPLREQVEGVGVLRFPVVPRRRGRGWELLLHYSTWLLGASLRILFHRHADWDLVFVYQTSPVTSALPALLLRLRSGAPRIIWIEDLWPETVRASGVVSHPRILRLIGRMSDWIYRSFDFVAAQSHAYLEVLAARGLDPVRTACIFNWAEDLYLKPVEPPAGPPWREGMTVMLAGNLGRAQGLDTVLEAMARIGPGGGVRWVIVGDGALRSWMEAEVLGRGLDGVVSFLGRRPLEDMPALFAQADVMLLSLGRDEVLEMTIPGRLQSYMAAGKPVIGSISGAAAEVIRKSGVGLASPAEDVEGLVACVRTFLDMTPGQRLELGRSGRMFYLQHFDRGMTIDALEMLFHRMAGPARSENREP